MVKKCKKLNSRLTSDFSLQRGDRITVLADETQRVATSKLLYLEQGSIVFSEIPITKK